MKGYYKQLTALLAAHGFALTLRQRLPRNLDERRAYRSVPRFTANAVLKAAKIGVHL
jgi:hypothetical protein